ncbi:MAG TPA: type II CAAX endopeptidase family protein [Ilumatobacter sp.]|nr:type II CAAX endopeptidase family protein [Ilumatobacter sp.]
MSSTDGTPHSHAATIPTGFAIGTWGISWVLGMLVLGPLVVVATGASLGDDLSVPQLAAATAVGWAMFAGALVVASRRAGCGDFAADYAFAFRPIDLVGIPVGVGLQIGLIPLMYRPLRSLWPTTFSTEEVEQRAQDLVDRAGDRWAWLLVLVVVVGAPIVEELVYRGLLQRSISRSVGLPSGLLLTSLWFAVIHPSAVEYPGLIVAGLVFGAGVVFTGRIGMGIATHVAFNAAGLAVIYWW